MLYNGEKKSLFDLLEDMNRCLVQLALFCAVCTVNHCEIIFSTECIAKALDIDGLPDRIESEQVYKLHP